MRGLVLVGLVLMLLLGCGGGPPSVTPDGAGLVDAGPDGPPPVPWDGIDDLSAVFATSRDGAWAVGHNGVLIHRVGGMWTPVESGTKAWLGSIWGSGPRDIWVVGAEKTMLHYDGTAWLPWPLPPPGPYGYIFGRGRDDVWLLVYRDSAEDFFHWDGTAWNPLELAGGRELPYSPNSMWPSPNGDLWATASDLVEYWYTIHVRRAGLRDWEKVGGTARYAGIATLWGANASAAWAVGRSDDDGALIITLEYPVAKWVVDGGFAPLAAVHGSGPTDVWAVGANGMIMHWDGSSWRQVDSGMSASLRDVWATAPDDAWAVGVGGTILHWDGVAWGPGR